MTGYFKLNQGNDQFTLIARQGPTYNDDGGCGAYGYYGMLSANGDAYFKKKLFHHGGYTDRTAVRQGVVGDLNERWIGIKMVAYNLDGGDVKLELWVDDGDETNDWQKATEYVDDGSWEVAGSGCGRDGDETIDEGTRGGFRVDDSQFEFKKLSIRDIVGSGDAAEAALMAEGEAAADEGEAAADEGEAAADEGEAAADEGEAAADEGEAEEVAVIEGTEDSDLLTVEIVSNGVESIVPATFRFSAHITGGTEPYTISWDFGDRSEDSDEQSVEHTFDEAGTYNVAVAVTDSDGETASDSLEITVEEATPAEEEATPAEEEATPAEEEATPAEEEATPAEEEATPAEEEEAE
jgi:PKD domain